MLILQLANGGTLRNCLESKWKDGKFEIPLLASRLKLPVGYVSYTKKICHRDLHSNNILINNGKILILDFGISKKMGSTTQTSSVKGSPAYAEPRYYLYPDKKIKCDEKETIIPGTPKDYAEFYMRCWDFEPEKRPTLEEILTELERSSKEMTIISVVNTKLC
ncbi:kinase-like domain-containing protein [Gigaspora rosea]|uniref:Kinase-like domain-containing protein n=1 Tax=Gigaspora rosea TaxID=44941 RepID=A0A397VQN3_9GLOM|nr:kinase-like domain-containing protein [Gigaspora rosea]